MPTKEEPPARRYKFARWIVMVVSVVNVLAAAATLVLLWRTAGNPELPVPTRINTFMGTVAWLLFAVVTFLIAWKAGDQPANIAITLPFAFAGSNEISLALLEQQKAMSIVGETVYVSTFILGAGFFILAAARFPRQLTPVDIAASRTIWGRIKPLRGVLIFFLRPLPVWIFVATATLLFELTKSNVLYNVTWIAIVLLGLIYFYIMYRSGEVETRRKVLWFFELTLFSLVFMFVWLGVHAIVPANSSETLHVGILVALYAIYTGGQLFCYCMAVFYAGAISPTLVIRKTFVYGVTVALLLFTYATIEAFVVNILVAKTGINDQFASALLGTALALTFHPFKNKMEHALKRIGSRTTAPQTVTP